MEKRYTWGEKNFEAEFAHVHNITIGHPLIHERDACCVRSWTHNLAAVHILQIAVSSCIVPRVWIFSLSHVG
jgi:hypothetical protein